MKHILLISSLVLSFTFAVARNEGNERDRVKQLEQKKTELRDSLKLLNDQWNRPRAGLSEEYLIERKHEHDSLEMDLKSKIVQIDLQITELYDIIFKSL